LMWVSVTLIYLLPAVVITIELLSPPRTDSIGPSVLGPEAGTRTRARSRARSRPRADSRVRGSLADARDDARAGDRPWQGVATTE